MFINNITNYIKESKPDILFLDEPTASLDPDIGDFVREYIETYKSKKVVHKILMNLSYNSIVTFKKMNTL